MSYEELIALETTKQSEFSPDVIQKDEIVARLLVPEHIDDDGSVLPTAFDHLVRYKEVSILRCKYDFEANKELTIEQLLRNPKNIYRGYITTSVESLKNLLFNETSFRVCYLVDSATKDKRGHADIRGLATQIIERVNPSDLSEKSLNLLIQKKLWDAFEHTIYEKATI